MSPSYQCLERSINAPNKLHQCKQNIGEWCAGNADARRPNMAAAERRQCAEVISHFLRTRPTKLTDETVAELQSAVPGAFFDEPGVTREIETGSRDSVGLPVSPALVSNSRSLPLDTGAKMFFEHFRCIEDMQEASFEMCIQPAEAACRHRATLIALKVLRVAMADVEPLLLRVPDLHIIHYVRDPRAVVVSRLDAGFGLLQAAQTNLSQTGSSSSSSNVAEFGPDEETVVVAESRYLCDRMLSDVRARHRLSARYPGAISVVRYEDLISNPVKVTCELFRRIGTIGPDEKYIKWLHEKLYGGTEGTRFETNRANASVTASRWRQRVSDWQFQQMNRHCRQVLLELGYEL